MNNKLITNTFISGLIISVFSFSSCTSGIKDNEWETLLDKDLSKWNIYQSYEMKNGYDGSIPTDAKGDTIPPIGYDKNYKNVFTIVEEGNEPVLRINGEVYGCVFTKASYRNYHLKLKVKWGDKKWEPRLEKDMDSGILYHSQGECGVDYWRTWMLSHEFQLIQNGEEGCSGDYWCIGSTQMKVRAQKNTAGAVFEPEAAVIPVGIGTPNGYYCAAITPEDKPAGDWNNIGLICYEGKSLHIVNGKVVLALSDLSYVENDMVKPLDEGKIQLQSEAAEVFFKNIEIKTIESIPAEYSTFFH